MAAEPAQDYLLSVIEGERKGVVASFLRVLFSILSWIYNAGLKIYLSFYFTGIRKQDHLTRPVISVGNLTVGGTGKTPITRLICETLTAGGLKVCVLCRGYKGENEFGAAIVADDKRTILTPAQAGDEAYMLSRMLPGIPVLSGKDRRVTGKMAIETFDPNALVLDDGMQFYQLHRDFEIVLFDALRPFHNGWTFPRGLLREPVSHVRRAHCAIITNADRIGESEIPAVVEKIRRFKKDLPVFIGKYRASELKSISDGSISPAGWLNSRKICGYCALGNPEGFRTQLQQLGADIVHWQTAPDHHEATMAEIKQLIESAVSVGAEAIIVTEKDAVKLPPIGRPIPILALRVTMELDDPKEFFTLLKSKTGIN